MQSSFPKVHFTLVCFFPADTCCIKAHIYFECDLNAHQNISVLFMANAGYLKNTEHSHLCILVHYTAYVHLGAFQNEWQ